jgi:DNA-binding response OmpR family regulator
MAIRLTLEHAGYRVETAADGSEGIDKFREGGPWDLVLLDQRMPDLEGIAVLQQIRYHDPYAKVIMITAFGTIDLAVDAMKKGATDFLRKPFTAETLRGAIQAALSSPPVQESAIPQGAIFGLTTINGYRIEFRPGPGIKMEGGLGFAFTVRSPTQEEKLCTVVLSPVVIELVRARADREDMPGGSRFWQALCEEALANYVWQNAEFPPDNLLHVDDLTLGLTRFVDAVLAEA